MHAHSGIDDKDAGHLPEYLCVNARGYRKRDVRSRRNSYSVKIKENGRKMKQREGKAMKCYKE